ncbi:hypothetical protein NKI74_33900 [Mesorhizobium sp. M0494]|uniref:DUF6904 family protein n=1 Tax=Mesorhizobium sp. M0494 TaxID=2956951 RepID=UPI003336403C
MLSCSLLRNHAGILLTDYTSLRWLHDTVHAVNERSPLVKDKEKEGLFLNLAYDVRKAYEQQREILQPPENFEEVVIPYGVQIIWPAILLQQKMIRTSLGYFDHSRSDQAVAYALEAILDEALKEDFGPQAGGIIDQWNRINLAYRDVFEQLYTRAALFSSWTKSQRKRQFADLLASFDPMYTSYYALRVSNGYKNLISPDEFETWADFEWPDPRW